VVKDLSIHGEFGLITTDLLATVVPFSLFTIASSLESQSSPASILSNVAKSATLAYMLLYTFTISNQINGIEEDRLNKPDRPIVSGRISLQAAYTRYVLLSIASLIYSRFMGVEEGAVMFMAFGAMHNFTELASFGPTKDLLTTAVLTSGLYSAWELRGGTTRRGLEWIIYLAFNLLFSISIQDLRDVIGDAATGRHTTPLMLGKPYGKPLPNL
jgi:4-hydroxybenzoate polyprenyltransferase